MVSPITLLPDRLDDLDEPPITTVARQWSKTEDARRWMKVVDVWTDRDRSRVLPRVRVRQGVSLYTVEAALRYALHDLNRDVEKMGGIYMHEATAEKLAEKGAKTPEDKAMYALTLLRCCSIAYVLSQLCILED